jgi:phosphoglycolate phosphatase
MTTVIFDLDGTLVDTAPDLMHATNHILTREGRRKVSFEEVRTMVGQGAKKLIERGFAATGAPVAEHRLKDLYRQFILYYEAHIAEESRPFPGAVKLLDRCAAAGIGLGICTNKLEGLSVLLIEALGLSHYFGAIVGPDTLRIPKPDAAPYREAVKRCGGEVHRSLLIGDSETDVLTARAAGVPVIAVTFGYSERYVAEFSPDHLVESFDAVWPIIEAYARASHAPAA